MGAEAARSKPDEALAARSAGDVAGHRPRLEQIRTCTARAFQHHGRRSEQRQ